MAEQQVTEHNSLGIWIRFWDLLIAFALLAAAFLMVRLDAIPQLRALAEDKVYFTSKPLLLDTMRHGYSFEMVRDHLRALGPAGRDYYASTFIPLHDMAMSLFLLTFMVLFVLYATQSDKPYAIGLPRWVRLMLLLPPVAQFVFDLGENLLLRSVIQSYPWINARLVDQASEFTQAKWTAILINSMIMLGLGCYTLYQWLTPPARRPGA